MPKIVDHEARRIEVAEAVWRVVHREGLERASVRNVAAEAGLSAGAMRHYFDGQADLQRVAMQQLVVRVARRIQAVDVVGEPLAVAERVLFEMLPLDEERQAEAEVWFAFIVQARVDPALRSEAIASYDAIRRVVRSATELVLGGAGAPGDVAASGLQREPAAAGDGVELEVEVERLFALLDGLVLHAVQRPGRRSARPDGGRRATAPRAVGRYSTVTLLARLRGLSMSRSRCSAAW